jgi:hypothetical protein
MFTQPGEVVLDPFMGGGTTLVEACSLGRQAVGTDISSLATFTAKVKTTPLLDDDFEEINDWASGSEDRLNLLNHPVRATEWIEQGYQKNISGRNTWPIRKTLELALGSLEELPSEKQRDFVRCALLGTAQWALDSRKEIPSAKVFRKRLLTHLASMEQGAREFTGTLDGSSRYPLKVTCLNRSVIGIEEDPQIADNPPRLILTSPPYPGVHAIYHRWQVQGRKKTPAPFWIANTLDGQGGAFYTFGDRRQQDLAGYYEQLQS